jgi:hypothetical protein
LLRTIQAPMKVDRGAMFIAGAPAMIPLKSPGYRCASMSASRPPVEQPS